MDGQLSGLLLSADGEKEYAVFLQDVTATSASLDLIEEIVKQRTVAPQTFLVKDVPINVSGQELTIPVYLASNNKVSGGAVDSFLFSSLPFIDITGDFKVIATEDEEGNAMARYIFDGKKSGRRLMKTLRFRPQSPTLAIIVIFDFEMGEWLLTYYDMTMQKIYLLPIANLYDNARLCLEHIPKDMRITGSLSHAADMFGVGVKAIMTSEWNKDLLKVNGAIQWDVASEKQVPLSEHIPPTTLHSFLGTLPEIDGISKRKYSSIQSAIQAVYGGR